MKIFFLCLIGVSLIGFATGANADRSNCADRIIPNAIYACEFESDDEASGSFSFQERGTFTGGFEGEFGSGDLDVFDDDLICTCQPRGGVGNPKFFESSRFICLISDVALLGKFTTSGTRIIRGFGKAGQGSIGTFVFKCKAEALE